MDISLINKSYDDIKFYIKLHFMNKAIENNSPLKHINYEGSNINTLIDTLAYIYTLLSFELDISVNEVLSIKTAKLNKNIYKKMQDSGFKPLRKTPSKITLQVYSDSATQYYKNDKLIITDSNGNEWYYIFDIDTIIDDVPTRITFTQGKEYTEEFYVDTKSNSVKLSNKWEISNNNITVLTQDGEIINEIDDAYDNIKYKNNEDIFNDKYYTVDYSDDNSLILTFSNGVFGSQVNGIVTVKYYVTNGTESNGLKSTEFTMPDDLKILHDSNYIDISNGGMDETSVDVIKELATLFKKMQNRIVTIEDLKNYLDFVFPTYNKKIFDSNNLPLDEVQLGKVFVYVYKMADGIVTPLDQIAFKKEIDYIKSKCKLGIVLIFGNIENIDINLDYVYKFNSAYNQNEIKNKIDNLLKNYINNQNVITELLLKQTIIQEKIDGLIDFNILKLSYNKTKLFNESESSMKTHKTIELSPEMIDNGSIDIKSTFEHISTSTTFEISNQDVYISTTDVVEINGTNQFGYILLFKNDGTYWNANDRFMIIYQYSKENTVQNIIDEMVLDGKNTITLDELLSKTNISNKTNIYYDYLYDNQNVKLVKANVSLKIDDAIISNTDMIVSLNQSNINATPVPIDVV